KDDKFAPSRKRTMSPPEFPGVPRDPLTFLVDRMIMALLWGDFWSLAADIDGCCVLLHGFS
ncbi:MAG: hypothetical protein LBI05_05445, partial [Planctomycetaceae bacterium]|nr:hypothetical protein [Planctomycetaceae bacterium]